MDSKEQLINLVQDHPCLYLKTHQDYVNKVAKENAWSAIGEKLGKTASESKKAWESIRGQYLAFRRKLLNPTGSAAGHRPYFRYEGNMEFCLDVPYDEDSNFSNVLGEENSTNSQLYEVPVVPVLAAGEVLLEIDIPRPPELPATSTAAKTTTNPRVHKKFGGKHKASPFEEKLLDVIKDDSSDEFDLFCRSMAFKLRRMFKKDPGAASDIQLKVHQLINDGERDIRDVTLQASSSSSSS